MGSVIEVASGIMGDAARQLELSAQNIANITTAGYKRRVASSHSFSDLVGDASREVAHLNSVDQSDGKMIQTGNPLSLALSGPGYFLVRGENFSQYVRGGLFQRGEGGVLTISGNLKLQGVDGRDIGLRPGPFEVLPDGVVTQEGEAVARVGVFDAAKAGIAPGRRLAADVQADAIDAPNVHQGMEEASNVSTGDEMVAVMAALRRAEAGQKLVGVYDDLMGRLITTLGQV